MPQRQIFTVTPTGNGYPDYSRVIAAANALVSVTNPLPVSASGSKAINPILTLATLAAAASSALAACLLMDLTRKYVGLTLTVEVTYNALAISGVRVHVLSSYDGINFDTADYDTWDVNFVANGTVRQTKPYDVLPAYMKVQIENRDLAQPVTALNVESTVGA